MSFIPQVEPYYTEAESNALVEYFKSGGWLTEHNKTKEFEQAICNLLGVKHAVAVPNGTIGLYLALCAVGVNRYDKVLVPAYTMVATPNSVQMLGAEPVFSDVDDQLCVDPNTLPSKTDASYAAVMHVSINGRAGNIRGVIEYCRKRGLSLIEDACQAFGSKYQDQYLGTFGDVGVFSLSPHKIITTGQGGLIVTNNERIANTLRKLKDFGRVSPGVDVHDMVGFNFKFTDVQAVIGLEQLKTIQDRCAKKLDIYSRYKECLPTNIHLFPLGPQTVPWFMDILVGSELIRDQLHVYLKQKGIETRRFYPPLNHQFIYSKFNKGSFPMAEELAPRGLWLPSSLRLLGEQVEQVCDAIRNFYKERQI